MITETDDFFCHQTIHLITEPWLPGGDELTPTMELERQVIEAKYAAEVVAAAVDRAELPVVLVGHSLGGVSVSQFAERDPGGSTGSSW